jgi:hypothetical protein
VGKLVMRNHFVGVGATMAALALSQAGAAAPERNEVIRMGVGIGKVQLGMTLPRVRRAFGGPHLAVYRRQNFGARGQYMELGWEFPGRTSWEPVVWRVGFRSRTRGGTLRAVRVSTTARSQRTTKGLGVGSRPGALAKAYRGATCIYRDPNLPDPGVYVVVSRPGGGMTAFEVARREMEPGAPYFVTRVMVQRAWYSKGRGYGSCPSGWEDM